MQDSDEFNKNEIIQYVQKNKVRFDEIDDVGVEEAEVDYPTFMKILFMFLNERQSEEEVREAFRALEDENGLVDLNELRYLCTKMDPKPS